MINNYSTTQDEIHITADYLNDDIFKWSYGTHCGRYTNNYDTRSEMEWDTDFEELDESVVDELELNIEFCIGLLQCAKDEGVTEMQAFTHNGYLITVTNIVNPDTGDAVTEWNTYKDGEHKHGGYADDASNAFSDAEAAIELEIYKSDLAQVITKSEKTGYFAEISCYSYSYELTFTFYDDEANIIGDHTFEITSEEYDHLDKGLIQSDKWGDKLGLDLEEEGIDGDVRFGKVRAETKFYEIDPLAQVIQNGQKLFKEFCKKTQTN